MVSKAFTKEDGAEDPPFVAPRAPLPAGAPNYVTPRGFALLRSELASLEASRSSIPLEASADAASARAALQTRIQELKARLAGAVLVDPSERRSSDEVRFGARVMVQGDSPQPRQIDIVGVDEADAASGRIAFVAPLARALLGKRPGDSGHPSYASRRGRTRGGVRANVLSRPRRRAAYQTGDRSRFPSRGAAGSRR